MDQREIRLKDIAEIWCEDPVFREKAEELQVFWFEDRLPARKVLSSMDLIRIIQEEWNEADIRMTGGTDVLISCEKTGMEKKGWYDLKSALVSLTVFFGAAVSVMGYNNDISVIKIFERLSEVMTGSADPGISVLSFCYASGLTIGVIVFFDHISKKRFSDDPTPLEIQMELYKKNRDQSLISGAGKEKEEKNADS